MTIDRDAIARAYALIRRTSGRTPVIELDGADFGLLESRCFQAGVAAALRLFQGARAFTNLLARQVSAGGGGGGFGRKSRGGRRIRRHETRQAGAHLCPHRLLAGQIARIRGYGADLVVTGDRYDDALAASPSGPPPPARFRCMPTNSTRRCSVRGP
jgi:threonine dehydratase